MSIRLEPSSSRISRWTIATLLILTPFLGYINFRLGEILLGLRPDSFEKTLADLPLDSKLLFVRARDRSVRVYAQELLTQAGFNEAVVKRLPERHGLEIPLSWVRAANPYPPVLAEFAPGYEVSWGYLSLGYLDNTGKYHQVTSYNGEADTTPSFLVTKARGDETRYGDYFVSYLFLLSRETGPQPEVVNQDGSVERWREPGIFLDAAEWRTYRGGSYDGFEEIGITLFGTIGEMLLIGVIVFLIMLRAAWKGRTIDQID